MSIRNWFILGGIIWLLSVLLAFGVGKMSAQEGERAPIIIEKAR